MPQVGSRSAIRRRSFRRGPAHGRQEVRVQIARRVAVCCGWPAEAACWSSQNELVAGRSAAAGGLAATLQRGRSHARDDAHEASASARREAGGHGKTAGQKTVHVSARGRVRARKAAAPGAHRDSNIAKAWQNAASAVALAAKLFTRPGP